MTLQPISEPKGTMWCIVSGIVAAGIAITAFSVVTTSNPIQDVLHLSRHAATVLTFFLFAAALTSGAATLRRCVVDHLQVLAACLGCGGAFLATIVGATAFGVAMDDALVLYVARYAWWVTCILALAELPVALRAIRAPASTSWSRWVYVGGVSLLFGFALFMLGSRTSAHAELMAKIVLILIIPVMCSLAIAIEAPYIVRIVAVMIALAGIAEAAIH